MNRIRPFVAIIATALLMAPASALAIDDDKAPLTPIGDSGWVIATTADDSASVFRLEGGPSLTDAGVVIRTVDPAQLPPPFDEQPADATIYQVGADADPGTYGYVRIQDRDTLSFIQNGETPVILRVGVGGQPPAFLRDQHIIHLPPPCTGETLITADCISDGILLDVAPELIGQTLDLPPGMAFPGDEIAFDDLVGVGTADGPQTMLGFGGGMNIDVDVRLTAGDNYEVRALATMSALFGGEVESISQRTVFFDAEGDALVPLRFDTSVPLVPGATGGDFFISSPCPPGQSGIVITDSVISGAGANLPDTLGPAFDPLAAGTDVLVSTVSPLVCLDLVDDRGGRVLDFAVSVGCVNADVVHTEGL